MPRNSLLFEMIKLVIGSVSCAVSATVVHVSQNFKTLCTIYDPYLCIFGNNLFYICVSLANEIVQRHKRLLYLLLSLLSQFVVCTHMYIEFMEMASLHFIQFRLDVLFVTYVGKTAGPLNCILLSCMQIKLNEMERNVTSYVQ